MQADTQVALATVLELAGKAVDAAAELARAAELYETKGNISALSRLTAAGPSSGTGRGGGRER